MWLWVVFVGQFGSRRIEKWCRRSELNTRPHPYQGCALPLSYGGPTFPSFRSSRRIGLTRREDLALTWGRKAARTMPRAPGGCKPPRGQFVRFSGARLDAPGRAGDPVLYGREKPERQRQEGRRRAVRAPCRGTSGKPAPAKGASARSGRQREEWRWGKDRGIRGVSKSRRSG